MGRKGKWWYSIETKLIIGFGMVITVIMIAATYIYHRAIILSRQTTYEKMYSQAEFYLQTLEQETEHIRQLQRDFFNDRKLTFLIGPEMNISDYEKRDALLSVMERMNTITGVSDLIQEGVLYLPKSSYRITSTEIKRMGMTDEEEVKRYMDYLDGLIHYDGNCFFVVEAGAPRISSDSVPNHILVIKFSVKKLQEKLASLNLAEESGAFIYNVRDDVIVEHSSGNYMGNEILQILDLDAGENYLNAQRMKIGKEHYLVFAGGQGTLGLFVEYRKENTIMGAIDQFRIIVNVIFILMLLVAVLFGVYSKRLIHKPITVLLKAFERIQSGNWSEHINHNRRDEFSYLYDGFNEMEDKMGEMIEKVYVQTNLAQRAQMKQLQTQIAPHFLYNSFFSLRRKIKGGDYENAEKLAKHLGAYFQYLTRNESDYVSLKQEVEHAKSYAAIQGTRFIYRISINFEELPEDFENLIVPRLVLQPLLENAFEYGLESKEKDGILWVHFAETHKEYQILIVDNGETPDEMIQELSRKLKEGKTGEVTGIYNIHKRLQILYDYQSGLRIERSSIGGVSVIMFIGKGGGESESEFADS